MKSKKILTAALCTVLIVSLMVSAAAITTYKFNNASESRYFETVNRVNISVSATEFSYNKINDDGMLTCSAVISIEKTEPEFYAFLHSVTLSGNKTGNIIYTAGKNNGDAVLPQNIAIPNKVPLEWEISFTVPFEEGKSEYNLSLDINYTTGMKTNTAQRYMTSIPIKLIIEK